MLIFPPSLPSRRITHCWILITLAKLSAFLVLSTVPVLNNQKHTYPKLTLKHPTEKKGYYYCYFTEPFPTCTRCLLYQLLDAFRLYYCTRLMQALSIPWMFSMRYNETLIKASKRMRIRMAITGITDNPLIIFSNAYYEKYTSLNFQKTSWSW